MMPVPRDPAKRTSGTTPFKSSGGEQTGDAANIRRSSGVPGKKATMTIAAAAATLLAGGVVASAGARSNSMRFSTGTAGNTANVPPLPETNRLWDLPGDAERRDLAKKKKSKKALATKAPTAPTGGFMQPLQAAVSKDADASTSPMKILGADADSAGRNWFLVNSADGEPINTVNAIMRGQNLNGDAIQYVYTFTRPNTAFPYGTVTFAVQNAKGKQIFPDGEPVRIDGEVAPYIRRNGSKDVVSPFVAFKAGTRADHLLIAMWFMEQNYKCEWFKPAAMTFTVPNKGVPVLTTSGNGVPKYLEQNFPYGFKDTLTLLGGNRAADELCITNTDGKIAFSSPEGPIQVNKYHAATQGQFYERPGRMLGETDPRPDLGGRPRSNTR